jgi:excisionase family DNA binding protein
MAIKTLATPVSQAAEIAAHPIPDPALVDIPTAAAMLSTTVFAVRELLRKGKIKYVVIGHKWLVSPQALQEFIQNNEGYFGKAS